MNSSKTEVMWFGSANNLAKLTPSDCDMRLQVGDDVIEPVTAVRNLGVMFDSRLTMQAHVAKTAQACFSIYGVCER